MTERDFFPMSRVLWAVDVFAEDLELQRPAAWLLRALSRKFKLEIEPVYMMATFPYAVPKTVPQEFLDQTRESGQDELNEMTRRMKLPSVQPLRVLPVSSLSTRESVDQLLEHARTSQADLIIVSTHARKGMRRVLMGSFAETLLLQSPVPTLVVNPHWNSVTELKHILFPTDFSDESQIAFDQVLDMAKALGAKVTLYHRFELPGAGYSGLLYEAYSAYERSIQDELESKREQVKRAETLARERGVKLNTRLDTRGMKSVADSILALGKEKGGIIMMASRSSSFSSTLLGSVTRRVLRDSILPVWVIRSSLAEKKSSGQVTPQKKVPRAA
jgi:nucleotide-binding universal stress UspA family protein